MVPARRLVAAVCLAIRGLKEPKGTSINTVISYVRNFIDGKTVTFANVKQAIRTALNRQYLIETRDGKYKLNVFGMRNKDIKVIDKMAEATMVIETNCDRITKRSQNEKRNKRLTCPPQLKSRRSRRGKLDKTRTSSRVSRHRTKARSNCVGAGRSDRRSARSSHRRGSSHRRSRSRRSRSPSRSRDSCERRSRTRRSRGRRSRSLSRTSSLRSTSNERSKRHSRSGRSRRGEEKSRRGRHIGRGRSRTVSRNRKRSKKC